MSQPNRPITEAVLAVAALLEVPRDRLGRLDSYQIRRVGSPAKSARRAANKRARIARRISRHS